MSIFLFGVPIGVFAANKDKKAPKPRPAMGIWSKALTKAQRTKLGLPADRGLKITDWMPHGSAREAGLGKGDIIISINGVGIGSSKDLRAFLKKKKVGDRIRVRYQRGTKRKTKTVTLRPWPRPGPEEKKMTYKGHPIVGLKVDVAVTKNANGKWLNKLKGRLRKASRMLWKKTYGNMAIIEINIYDRSKEGDFIIENFESNMCSSWKGVYGYWDANNQIHLGGNFLVLTFLHEFGHVKFSLPEEYNGNDCECFQSTDNTIRYYWCTDKSHRAKGKSCWARIFKKYPDWRKTIRSKPGPAPPITFTVKNN